jgi:hypothetical protein
VPTQADRPSGLHLSAFDFVEHFVVPSAFVRQQVTDPGCRWSAPHIFDRTPAAAILQDGVVHVLSDAADVLPVVLGRGTVTGRRGGLRRRDVRGVGRRVTLGVAPLRREHEERHGDHPDQSRNLCAHWLAPFFVEKASGVTRR